MTVVVQRLSDAAAIFLPLFGSWLPERLQPAQSVIASRVTVPNFKTTYILAPANGTRNEHPINLCQDELSRWADIKVLFVQLLASCQLFLYCNSAYVVFCIRVLLSWEGVDTQPDPVQKHYVQTGCAS